MQNSVQKMAEVLLTDRFLKAAKPTPGEATTRYWDKVCKGLWVHVGRRRKTFYARAGGRDHNIGHCPLTDLRQGSPTVRRDTAGNRYRIGSGSPQGRDRPPSVR